MPALRSLPAADSLATRLREARQARREHRDTAEHGARELVLIAFAVPVIALVVTLVVVLGVLLMAGGALSGTLTAVAACWLAINQVPLTISGVTVGVLPLLPTLIVAGGTTALVASGCRDRYSNAEFIRLACAAIGGPMLVSAISLAVIMDGASVLPIQSPDPLVAFAMTFVVHGIATLAGIALGRSDVVTATLSASDRRGIRYGLVAVLALIGVGGLLVLVRLIMRFDVMGELVAQGYDFDGYLGLTVLSILYLPNLMIGAAAVLLGSTVHVGTASVDLFSVTGGTVPPLPALAILPTQTVSWAPVGLIVPAAIAGFVAWRCRAREPMVAIRTIGIAGAVAATTMVVVGWLAGGRLGELGSAGITVATAGVFILGWLLGAGVIVAVVCTVLPTLRARGGASADDAETDWLDDVEAAADYDDDYLTATADDEPYDPEYDDADPEYDGAEYDGPEADMAEYTPGDDAEPEYEEADHAATEHHDAGAGLDVTAAADLETPAQDNPDAGVPVAVPARVDPDDEDFDAARDWKSDASR